MFIKEFEVRWSDVDANRHLGNSAYVNFMSHARMSFLKELGVSPGSLTKYNIGAVVFYEHIYYFKELFPNNTVRVSVELTGLSEDGMYFEFTHNFYDEKGNNNAHGEMMGAWIDFKTRKLTALPEALLELFKKAKGDTKVKVLTKKDTRRFGKVPQPLATR